MAVAVTLPLFADFVREIGGDHVEVFSLIPPGADPHTYELSAADIQRIGEADFFFINGLGLDSRMEEVIEANRNDDAKVILFAANMSSPRAVDLGDPGITAEEAGDNPHLWLDPIPALSYADLVADIFIIYDGINEGFYKTNLAARSGRVGQLDQEIRERIQDIPKEKRNLITWHDSFSLFARRYGLKLVDFVVSRPLDEPTSADIARVRQAIAEHDVPAVFAEHGFAADALSDIAADSGVPVCTLYSDVLGETVQTYIDMMRFNVAEIRRCLGAAGDE